MKPPIMISPAMVEDVKKVPALAAMLEAGTIAVKPMMPTAGELAHGKWARVVKPDGSIERIELEDIWLEPGP